MFGSKHRAEKKAAEAAAEKQHSGANLRSTLSDLIAIAGGGDGDAGGDWPLVLKPGERIVHAIQGGGLFEPRRLPGHWQGRSAGVSVPIADGIRLRLGKSAGTFVQGDETPTVIDSGDVSVTTQRVVFQGTKYTREWAFARLVGLMHYADQPRTAIQVSNRQKTSGIAYPGLEPELVRLRLTVAFAIFNGDTTQIAQQLRGELAKLDETPAPAALPGPPDGKPAPLAPDRLVEDEPATDAPPEATDAPTPSVPAPAEDSNTGPSDQQHPPPLSTLSQVAEQSESAPAESPPALPPPTWAPDPSGRHQFRYWDGGRWTDYVSDDGNEIHDPLPGNQP